MSFQTALTGLNAAQADLDVTGNNISNSSTTGFKYSRAEFANMYANMVAGSNKTNIGAGVKLAQVAQQFAQGSINTTNNNMDLAISGEGFFVTKGATGDDTKYYTRAGAFGVNKDGDVVNAQGHVLQKYDNGQYSNLNVLTTAGAPSATTSSKVNLNLDASATTPANAFSTGDPTSYNFSTSTTAYDSLGTAHTATLYFRKQAAPATNSWDVYMGMDGGAPATSGPVTMAFKADGSLDTAASTNGGVPDFFGTTAAPTFTPTSSANPMSLSVDFTGSTQYGATSAVNSISQDGYPSGQLSGINIDSSGSVTAQYTNGASTTLGTVAMATFANPQGLQQVGNTDWVASPDSGTAVPGTAGTGNIGQLQSGALEDSNVDLSKQLVNMIMAQRNYQANAKMISTETQVEQTIVNIR